MPARKKSAKKPRRKQAPVALTRREIALVDIIDQRVSLRLRQYQDLLIEETDDAYDKSLRETLSEMVNPLLQKVDDFVQKVCVSFNEVADRIKTNHKAIDRLEGRDAKLEKMAEDVAAKLNAAGETADILSDIRKWLVSTAAQEVHQIMEDAARSWYRQRASRLPVFDEVASNDIVAQTASRLIDLINQNANKNGAQECKPSETTSS